MRFSYAELIWRLPFGIAVFLNINIAIVCFLKQKPILGICLAGLTLIISLFISHRYPGEIKQYLRKVYNNSDYGKRVTDLVAPGFGLARISIRKNGVLFFYPDNYFFISNKKLEATVYSNVVCFHSNELINDKLIIKVNKHKKKLLEAYYYHEN